MRSTTVHENKDEVVDLGNTQLWEPEDSEEPGDREGEDDTDIDETKGL